MDSTPLKFILKGVTFANVTPTKAPPKFTAKPKAKPNGKMQGMTTYEGYTVKLANVSNVNFEGEHQVQNCWWDTQPYDDELICIPYEFKRVKVLGKPDKLEFKGPGSFCSIFCLWAYLCDEQRKQPHLRDSRLDAAMSNTRIAFNSMFTRDIVLKSAPDWRLLDIFGGPLSIIQFRKSSYDKVYIKLPNVNFNPTVLTYSQD